MGLLDDAIREHLEFKRLHGADLDEVARQEHEALGPVYHGASPGDVDAHSGGDPRALDSSEVTSASVATSAESHGGQETAEIDMRTVLEADLPRARAHAPVAGRAHSSDASPGSSQPAPSGGGQRDASPEDSLEWEVPDGQRDTQGSHGQHRAESIGEQEQAEGDAEVSDDVLEETPEFLRETPDQERLWFEQQPPRDFDFK